MCYLAAQLLIQNDSDLPQGLAGHPEGRLSVSIGPSVTDGHSSVGGRPTSDIRRREFAALVGGAALLLAAKVRRARGQQPAGRLRHIGLLHPGTSPNPHVEAFRQGLRDLGVAVAAAAPSTTQPTQETTAKLPKIEVVRLSTQRVQCVGFN